MWRSCSSAILVCAVAACGANTPSQGERVSLEQRAIAALGDMRQRDPGLDQLLAASAGYAVFPEIGAGGAFVVGGAFGRGILFEHGRATGYVEVRQGSIGPQLGGQTYAELVVLRDPIDIRLIRGGTFRMGADASAVVLNAGAAAATQFASGVTVFVLPRGGLMAGVTLNGQQIVYRPLSG
jgi:lipid-binding SYLF domain-containing protein